MFLQRGGQCPATSALHSITAETKLPKNQNPVYTVENMLRKSLRQGSMKRFSQFMGKFSPEITYIPGKSFFEFLNFEFL